MPPQKELTLFLDLIRAFSFIVMTWVPRLGSLSAGFRLVVWVPTALRNRCTSVTSPFISRQRPMPFHFPRAPAWR